MEPLDAPEAKFLATVQAFDPWKVEPWVVEDWAAWLPGKKSGDKDKKRKDKKDKDKDKDKEKTKDSLPKRLHVKAFSLTVSSRLSGPRPGALKHLAEVFQRLQCPKSSFRCETECHLWPPKTAVYRTRRGRSSVPSATWASNGSRRKQPRSWRRKRWS